MAFTFYIFGALGVILGIAWSALAMMQPVTDATYSSLVLFARLIVVAPGLSLAAGGLLFMAIGGVLSRLDRIVENTRSQPPRRRDPLMD